LKVKGSFVDLRPFLCHLLKWRKGMFTKNQYEFLKNFEGMARGKYLNTILAFISLFGDTELKQLLEKKFGRKIYENDTMYLSREVSLMMEYAAEKGVPIEKLGRNSARTYERSFPEVFKNMTPEKAVDLLIIAYSTETSSTISIKERTSNSAIVERKNNPLPCDFFKGVILELFEMVGVTAQVKETGCQWKETGSHCVFDISW
jgi:hypothetical protein